MRKICECKLPYVRSGTDTCTRCNNQQTMFLPIESNMHYLNKSIKKDYTGSEFKRGDTVAVIGISYSCLVEVHRYLKRGWWLVILPNGGLHETQILGEKLSVAKNQ